MRPFQAWLVRCEFHPIHKFKLFAGMDPEVAASTSRRPSIYNVAVRPSLRYLLVELSGGISKEMSFE
jgi:hypothetical protein